MTGSRSSHRDDLREQPHRNFLKGTTSLKFMRVIMIAKANPTCLLNGYGAMTRGIQSSWRVVWNNRSRGARPRNWDQSFLDFETSHQRRRMAELFAWRAKQGNVTNTNSAWESYECLPSIAISSASGNIVPCFRFGEISGVLVESVSSPCTKMQLCAIFYGLVIDLVSPYLCRVSLLPGKFIQAGNSILLPYLNPSENGDVQCLTT